MRTFHFCAPLEIQAAAHESGKSLPAFKMTAYTGDAMNLGYQCPVVLDLESTKTPRQNIPVLRNHDPERIAGHTTSVVVSGQGIAVAGVLSGENEHSSDVVRMAANGFPWQGSVGVGDGVRNFIGEGQKVTVNDRDFKGPIFVYRGAVREVSIVSIGADGATTTTVAAEYDAWLAARGFTPAELTAEQSGLLRLAFDSEPAAAAVEPDVSAPSDDDDQDEWRQREITSDAVAAMRRNWNHAGRIVGIEKGSACRRGCYSATPMCSATKPRISQKPSAQNRRGAHIGTGGRYWIRRRRVSSRRFRQQ
jgi:hypothetical protein